MLIWGSRGDVGAGGLPQRRPLVRASQPAADDAAQEHVLRCEPPRAPQTNMPAWVYCMSRRADLEFRGARRAHRRSVSHHQLPDVRAPGSDPCNAGRTAAACVPAAAACQIRCALTPCLHWATPFSTATPFPTTWADPPSSNPRRPQSTKCWGPATASPQRRHRRKAKPRSKRTAWTRGVPVSAATADAAALLLRSYASGVSIENRERRRDEAREKRGGASSGENEKGGERHRSAMYRGEGVPQDSMWSLGQRTMQWRLGERRAYSCNGL